MRRVRGFLITLIIGALAIRLVWAALSPLIPYALGALVAITVVSALYYRRFR